MNCPRCGHPCDIHGKDGCFACFQNWGECPLTEAEATRAAQRQAAAVTLWKIDEQRWLCRRVGALVEFAAITQALFAMRSLLRDLGISRPAPGGKE